MRHVTLLVLFALFITMIPMDVVHAHKRDSISDVAMDGLWGGLVGTLVGGATLAFVEHSSEHTDNIKIGAGVGIILGTAYGSMQLSRSLVQVNDGEMAVQIPVIEPTRDSSTRGNTLFWKLNLIKIAF